MAAARRHVFVEKVLKRLFPCDQRDQEKRAPPPAAPEAPPKKTRHRHVPPVAGGGTEAPPRWRLYTAAPPPERSVPAPAPPAPTGCSGSDTTCSGEDDTGAQDPHDQPKRRRIRKHKTKKTFKNPNNAHVEQGESEKRQTLSQETSQPRHTEGPTISKNRKRKLKKKQQMKRKRAAGLLAKASGISFLYEPREGHCEHSDVSEDDRGPGLDTGDLGDAEAGAAGAGAPETADGILEFLKSTQEMYLYDGVSQDPDPAFLGAAEELFTGLEARSVSATDVLGLEQLKALLLLQDPERLQRALQVFTEHCAMPPDQAGVVSALFNYWATHMLPERSRDGSRGPCLPGAGAQQGATGSPGDLAGHREDGAP